MSTKANLVMRMMGSILVFRYEDYKCLINFAPLYERLWVQTRVLVAMQVRHKNIVTFTYL